jgi:hypothetical protein
MHAPGLLLGHRYRHRRADRRAEFHRFKVAEPVPRANAVVTCGQIEILAGAL